MVADKQQKQQQQKQLPNTYKVHWQKNTYLLGHKHTICKCLG